MARDAEKGLAPAALRAWSYMVRLRQGRLEGRWPKVVRRGKKTNRFEGNVDGDGWFKFWGDGWQGVRVWRRGSWVSVDRMRADSAFLSLPTGLSIRWDVYVTTKQIASYIPQPGVCISCHRTHRYVICKNTPAYVIRAVCLRIDREQM